MAVISWRYRFHPVIFRHMHWKLVYRFSKLKCKSIESWVASRIECRSAYGTFIGLIHHFLHIPWYIHRWPQLHLRYTVYCAGQQTGKIHGKIPGKSWHETQFNQLEKLLHRLPKWIWRATLNVVTFARRQWEVLTENEQDKMRRAHPHGSNTINEELYYGAAIVDCC